MSMFSESLRAFLKPVVHLLDDPEVSEILINGPSEIWVERKGKLSRTDCAFTEDGLLAAARNMAQYVGRPLTEERPRLDARLPDGSRIHVVLPPIARRGTTISIRKFFAEKLVLGKLIELGSMNQQLARLLEVLVGLRLNIVVAGGTGSGKTSLLNVLSQLIAPDERILTIEDSAELQLTQPHIVSFESRPADRLGKGEVDIGALLHSALRLRPDRIIVGEVRGGECFYLLQAMNTGHGGTLTTAHANTPVDTLRRLESLCLLSGVDLPLRAVRAQVASAVHIVVCCERFADGTRKVTQVSEVLPLDEKGEYRVQDLYGFNQTGRTAEGTILGDFGPAGALPSFFRKLTPAGFGDLDERFFGRGEALPARPRAPGALIELTAVAAPAQTLTEARPAPLPAVALAFDADARPSPDPAPQAPAAPTVPLPPRVRTPETARPAARRTQTIEDAKPPEPIRSLLGAPRSNLPPVVAPIALRKISEPPPQRSESSIELEPELAAELERRLPTESTLITRNPLLEGPPRRRPAPGQGSSTDDETSPGTRPPGKPLR